MAALREAAARVPKPIEPGPEMEAIERFFRNCTWEGKVEPNGMGPGTPAMSARGRGTHTTIQDGRWIVGDYEQDQLLGNGDLVLTWQLHWVIGWDPDAREYRGLHADNYGHGGVMRGTLDGDVLRFESLGDAPVRLRMTWNGTDPEAVTWRNESSVDDGPWSLIEEYTYSFE